jgi:Baseplate J-like protein
VNYFCCDERRRNAIRGTALNGIDFLEVLDQDAATLADRQRFLFVHFVNPLAPGQLTVDNLCLDGGERIRDIAILDATLGAGPDANVLTVEVEEPGDYSIYRLSLVTDSTHPEPPDGIDPALAAVEFSFKVECPSDFDCAPGCDCEETESPAPPIDYLAKDYATFRRLMLDRMAAIAPGWTERNAADLGVTLVELLAYVADNLSYQQDAVATEAYLGTARKRVSVRRHARLVDYFLDDGSNARAWVHVRVSGDVLRASPLDPPAVPAGTALATRLPNQGVALPADPALLAKAQAVFETVHPLDELFAAHDELPFHTWSDQECCLPKGATHATLRGHFPNLHPGDVLLFEEVLGPRSGGAADADPTRRHAVRLTAVTAFDGLGDPLVDPAPGGPRITEIEWDLPDALPFPFCVSTRTDPEHGGEYVEDVSVARGNMVLADHGRTLVDEPLGAVPAPTLFHPPGDGCDPCAHPPRQPLSPRFRPLLAERPLTHAWPYDPAAPAADALVVPARGIVPAIHLVGTLGPDAATWLPRRDLLGSAADASEFVVEIESDLGAHLRFGDDEHGARPNEGTELTATYRVGNGAAGNLGAGALRHIVTAHAEIVAVRNPLPARGGREPESLEDARKNAPEAFRVQQRAVTAADYAEVTERSGEVQRAAATFRWTGSWSTVFITADRHAGLDVDEPFEARIRDHVEPFRMAGYDLEVDGPRFVPLEVEMEVCVDPDYFRSDVEQALLEVFSNRALHGGRRGLFHPDNFTFGQSVYLSPLYAAAQQVAGVASVEVTKFQRLGVDDTQPLEDGELALDRLEIARLDNDRNFAERGVFKLSLGGGK